jgi:hypothetical protein
LKELNLVFKQSKAAWLELYSKKFPYKAKQVKSELASAICSMRKDFIRSDATWPTTTLEAISTTIETEEAEISSTVRERLQRFADHPFIHLCIRV